MKGPFSQSVPSLFSGPCEEYPNSFAYSVHTPKSRVHFVLGIEENYASGSVSDQSPCRGLIIA